MRARQLRAAATGAEKALWQRLRGDQLGVRVRRQVVFRQSLILDFYIPELKLAIEIDGSPQADSESDRQRDRELALGGVTVARLRNDEVIGDLAGVIGRIAGLIAKMRARPVQGSMPQ